MVPKKALVTFCHIQNKKAKTKYYALKLRQYLNTGYVVLLTKFHGNPLQNG